MLCVYRSMDSVGMLAAEFADRVPRGPNGEPLACGIFAFPKDEDRNRGITNCTPPNSVETAGLRHLGPSKSLFSHASCFCDIQLTRNHVSLLSALDLPDFYHIVEVSRKRAMWQQFGRHRDIAEVENMSAAGAGGS